jgi:hypothetical protein
MWKEFLETILWASALVLPLPAMAGVGIHITISPPPPIVFAAPPQLLVIPETYVYVVPDQDVDIFFYGGWWWRPWDGRWYRSRDYSSGWSQYQTVPSFYRDIPSTWRNDYRERRWRGHQWNLRLIPQQQLQRNWNGWERDRYWENQQTWGVQGLEPRIRSQQQYREVQPQHYRPQQNKVYRERTLRNLDTNPQSRKGPKTKYIQYNHGKQK